MPPVVSKKESSSFDMEQCSGAGTGCAGTSGEATLSGVGVPPSVESCNMILDTFSSGEARARESLSSLRGGKRGLGVRSRASGPGALFVGGSEVTSMAQLCFTDVCSPAAVAFGDALLDCSEEAGGLPACSTEYLLELML